VTENELSDLATRLQSRSRKVWYEALRDAFTRGKSTEPLLVPLLIGPDHYRVSLTAAVLGDLGGPGPADEHLRSLLQQTGPGTEDVRCAALLAFAKRVGPAATEDCLKALASTSAPLKSYALMCLAAVGDDRGWEEVFGYLSHRLQRTHSTRNLSPCNEAIDYLVRHAGTDEERRERLVTLLLKRWDRLTDHDRAWLATSWPDLKPGPSQAGIALPPPESLTSRNLSSTPMIRPRPDGDR